MLIIGVGLVIVAAIAVLGVSKLVAAGSGAWSLGHFTAYLAATVRRNLPLGAAIEVYAEDLPLRAFVKRICLRTIAGEVDHGRALAEVLADYPTVFPPSYRALVAAGERGGSLAAVLEQLRATAELDDSLGRRALGYAMYPLFLFLVLTCAWGFQAVFIIPELETMFREMDLPGGVSPLFYLALQVLEPLIIGLVAVVAVYLVARFLLGGPASRFAPHFERAGSWLRWHLPLLARYERRRVTAGYALAASHLLEAGVPLAEALEIAAEAAGSRYFGAIAHRAAERALEGQPLGAALVAAAAPRRLPSDFIWYLEVGQSSGRLPEALSRAAESSFARARSALTSIVGLIFPAGVLIMGALVGMTAYTIFHALTSMMNAMAL
jgi:general secretion pathway protein F